MPTNKSKTCNGCEKGIKDDTSLSCHDCKCRFCFDCLNAGVKRKSDITKEILLKMKCPNCIHVNTGRRTRNDSTPARGQQESSSFSAAESLPSPQSTLLTFERVERLFEDKNAELLQSMKPMIAEEINIAMEKLEIEFNKTTEFLMDEIKDLKEKLYEKDTVIKDLQTQQASLNKNFNQLNMRLSAIDKISREKNFEIQAVPENKEDNTLQMVMSLCEKVGHPLKDENIHACRRVAKMENTDKRPRNILVTCSSPRIRDEILSAASSYNKAKTDIEAKLNTKDLGIDGRSTRIYVCEHLSPETKQVHTAARKFKRENNYKYVWVRNGQIYLRKEDDSKAVRITKISDLHNLK